MSVSNTAAATPCLALDLRSNERAVAQTRLWLAFTVWLGLILAVMPFDDAITAYLGSISPRHSLIRRLFVIPENLFRWWTLVAIGVALALRPDRFKLLRAYVVLLVGSTALLHTMKFLIGRARPDSAAFAAFGPYHFEMFGNPQVGFDSFPSGHTVTIVLIVLLLFRYAPRLAWISLIPALLAMTSRLALLRHFPSDVLGGVGLAMFCFCAGLRIFGAEAFPRLRARTSPVPPRVAERAQRTGA